jgi:hypothetical protein
MKNNQYNSAALHSTQHTARRNFRSSLTSLTVLAAVALAGCGGGEEVDYYGAIAVNPTTRAAGISYNYQSQADANAGASSQCGLGCSVVATYGNGMCGALARGSNGAVGYAVNSSKSQAESTALSQCRSAGGTLCAIGLSECNG